MHVQGHLGIALDKSADSCRQSVASLGVGGGNGQRTLLLVGVLLGHLLDTFNLAQHFSGGFQNRFAGRGDMGQVLATASKYLYPKFILQQAYLFADAGL